LARMENKSDLVTIRSCQICRSIIEMASKPLDYRRKVELGTNKDIAEGDCPIHMSLFESFGPDFWVERPSSRGSIWKGYGSSTTLSETGRNVSDTYLHRVCPLSHAVRILDPDWIRTSILRQWKEICARTHHRKDKTKCLTSPAVRFLRPSKPQFFIDTWLRCLSSASAKDQYVTLSYVWGSARMFTTIKSNVALLKLPAPWLIRRC
jgi:hypothetical protein